METQKLIKHNKIHSYQTNQYSNPKEQIECISENNTNTQSEIITGIKPPKEEIQTMQTGIIDNSDNYMT